MLVIHVLITFNAVIINIINCVHSSPSPSPSPSHSKRPPTGGRLPHTDPTKPVCDSQTPGKSSPSPSIAGRTRSLDPSTTPTESPTGWQLPAKSSKRQDLRAGEERPHGPFYLFWSALEPPLFKPVAHICAVIILSGFVNCSG